MAEPVASELRLSTPVRQLPGVGDRRARLLARLGVATVSDLLRHVPMRYEKQFAEGTIRDLPMEGVGTARGTLVNVRHPQPMRGGRSRTQATLADHSDTLSLVWFNAPYLRDKLHPGMTLRVQGRVKAFGGYPQMINPRWEPLDDAAAAPRQERLRPVYPSTESLPSTVIEQMIDDVLPRALPLLTDPLPAEFRRRMAMPTLADAFAKAHRPTTEDDAKEARRRLAFNELLLLQMAIAVKRHYTRTSLAAPALRWSAAVDEHIRARFPFALTDAQDHVVKQIVADLQAEKPMNRLLQGDVGAGKTIVALYALLVAVANRKQGALMAPTELLAEQHFASISRVLEGSNVRLALLTGGVSTARSAERNSLLRAIAAGEVDIVIGTQALLTETVRFDELAVVVVDEQHRFGVMQRAMFKQGGAGEAGGERGGGEQPQHREQKAREGEPGAPSPPPSSEGRGGRLFSPHYLVMTATPIPRTLSLTVFGDLDVSTIRGLPPGRTPITTRVVGEDKSDDVYRYLARRVAQGGQGYVVVPTIDAAGHELRQLKNVSDHVKLLGDKYLPGHRVAAVHGRLKRQTREAIMDRFRRGLVHVLVATTVIEVGVDVPNATVMVVEHAERFGLAQLHQLRGRIGRGTHGKKSVCVLVAEPTTDEARLRLEAVASTNDGFVIAEKDWEIRGMGELFGTRQHGDLGLRVAQLPRDMDLLQAARREANALVEKDPLLTDPSHAMLRRLLLHHYGESLGLIDVG